MIPPNTNSMGQKRVIATLPTAFTLIELLLVVTIIGFLLAIASPAVQRGREAQRRATCQNQLRQIGIGIHQYADLHNCLPIGRTAVHDYRYAGPNPPCTAIFNDKSYLISILPHIEQKLVYNAINHALSIFAIENTTVHTAHVELFCCPSDTGTGRAITLNAGQLAPMASDPPGRRWRMMQANYWACAGSFPVNGMPAFHRNCSASTGVITQSNGCFNDFAPITLSDVKDGLSTTLFVAEVAVTTLPELVDVPMVGPEKLGKYVSGDLGDTLFVTFYPPNAFKKISAVRSRAYSSSSLHPGGVNGLMGDGSVRFFDENIESWPLDPFTGNAIGATLNANGWWDNAPPPQLWQAIGTRSGSELIDQRF